MSTTETATRKWGGHWISDVDRLAIYIRDSFMCAYCGRDLRNASARDVTLDHLLPRSKGGKHSSRNLVTACRSCNSARGNRPWVDYAPGGARDRIEQLRMSPLNRELARAILRGDIARETYDVERVRAI